MRGSPRIVVAKVGRRIGPFLFLLALVRCDSGPAGPGKNGIGGEGGTVTLAGGGVTLSIPPDALAETVRFSAGPTSSFPASDLIVPGSTYSILPSETTFDRLVRLTLSYDPARLPQGVRETELRLFQVAGHQWELVVNASVDTKAHTVFGTVSRLGVFGAGGAPATSVLVSPAYWTLEQGQTKRLTGVGLDAGGLSLPDRAVTWSSSDESVATVDAEGLVTAVGVGQARIRASVEGRMASSSIQTWSCAGQTQIPTAECRALIDIYGAANRTEWRSSDRFLPSPDPCAWLGVTCEGGSVSELQLRAKQFPGSISYSIKDLTNLTSLDLSGNQLKGPIPAVLGDLTSLQRLDLTANDLSGPIPSTLVRLSELTWLALPNNELTGPIPPGIGSLAHLAELNLQWNELSGPIPSELGNLSSLTNLGLMDNHFSGSIPAELANLSALTDLSLSFNELTGQIPPELGALSNLTSLGIGHNQLTGPIPADLGNLSKLDGFYLNVNQLSGPVPLPVARLGGEIQAREGGIHNCVFTPPGNEGLTIPDTQEFRDADKNGDGKICGVPIGGSP